MQQYMYMYTTFHSRTPSSFAGSLPESRTGLKRRIIKQENCGFTDHDNGLVRSLSPVEAYNDVSVITESHQQTRTGIGRDGHAFQNTRHQVRPGVHSRPRLLPGTRVIAFFVQRTSQCSDAGKLAARSASPGSRTLLTTVALPKCVMFAMQGSGAVHSTQG